MRNLTICGIPIAAYTIVTPESPDPAVSTAAAFLQRVITTSCGVTLPIATAPTNHNIFLGTREPSPEVKWDGFRMSTDTTNLYLDGNIPRGTLYAAYDFAETYLGCRFFAADCEVIPTEGEADVPSDLCRVDNPAFEVRRIDNADWFGEAEAYSRGRFNANAGADMTPYGGLVYEWIPCHTMWKYCPGGVYFDEHPEYYSLHGGKRIPCSTAPGPGQLCLTNPDVLRIVTENVLRELREHPETTLLDLSQADNRNFCECDACRAVDEEEGSHSGTMIRFVNAVAEAVEREFPHVMIQTFAYEYTRVPPKKTKARHNVIIRYCTIEACFRHGLNDMNCEWNGKRYGKELADWQKKADRLSVWDYTTNYNSYIAPFPNLIGQFESVRFLCDCHVIHIFGENSDHDGQRASGAHGELTAYLLSKLYWNPYMTKAEYDRHINEFLAAYYGKGWEHIRRYIDLEHDATAHRHIGCFEYVDIHAVGNTAEAEIPGIKRFFRQYYDVMPYQPVYPGHVFTELCGHMDEILAMWDKAYDLAETELQKMHADRSRVSVRYMELVMTPHNEDTMTPEEKAVHEANVAQFLSDKKKYKLYYDLLSANVGR